MKILVLDNYDSFTYNLVYLIRQLGFGAGLDVIRNDKITVEEVAKYDKILLSPGPGIPDEAGIMKDVIKEYAPTKSILGVCLGHQGIAEVFGATLHNMPKVLHGVADKVKLQVDGEELFENVPDTFEACHYHSWTVLPGSINGHLKVTAIDQNDNIMAIRHQQYDVKGLQFHPESILTQHGSTIIENWLKN